MGGMELSVAVSFVMVQFALLVGGCKKKLCRGKLNFVPANYLFGVSFL